MWRICVFSVFSVSRMPEWLTSSEDVLYIEKSHFSVINAVYGAEIYKLHGYLRHQTPLYFHKTRCCPGFITASKNKHRNDKWQRLGNGGNAPVWRACKAQTQSRELKGIIVASRTCGEGLRAAFLNEPWKKHPIFPPWFHCTWFSAWLDFQLTSMRDVNIHSGHSLPGAEMIESGFISPACEERPY